MSNGLSAEKDAPAGGSSRRRFRLPLLPPLHGGYRPSGAYDGSWPPIPPKGPGGGSRVARATQSGEASA